MDAQPVPNRLPLARVTGRSTEPSAPAAKDVPPRPAQTPSHIPPALRAAWGQIPPMRTAKIARVRRSLAAGHYLTPQRQHTAMANLLRTWQEIAANRPSGSK
jgi:hypothetical protein